MRIYGKATSIVVLLALPACSADNGAQNEAIEAATSQEAAAESVVSPPVEASSTQVTTSAPVQIEGIENRRISFEAGASSATLEGSITGYEVVDYLLNVRQGQAINISMATQNTAAYFNILEPGETDVAIYVGSTSGNQFEGMTAKSGDYRIRVYMMRSAARREETANYRLEMIVS